MSIHKRADKYDGTDQKEQKNESELTAGVLKEDQNTHKVKDNAFSNRTVQN